MSCHHDFDNDVAIIGTGVDSRSDAVVTWGQRGRRTNPNVIDRLRFVIDALYPGELRELHGCHTVGPRNGTTLVGCLRADTLPRACRERSGLR